MVADFFTADIQFRKDFVAISAISNKEQVNLQTNNELPMNLQRIISKGWICNEYEQRVNLQRLTGKLYNEYLATSKKLLLALIEPQITLTTHLT